MQVMATTTTEAEKPNFRRVIYVLRMQINRRKEQLFTAPGSASSEWAPNDLGPSTDREKLAILGLIESYETAISVLSGGAKKPAPQALDFLQTWADENDKLDRVATHASVIEEIRHKRLELRAAIEKLGVPPAPNVEDRWLLWRIFWKTW